MTTVFFGKFLGIIITVIALGFLLNKEQAKKVVADLEKGAGLQFFAGVIPLLVGTSVILLHNVWAHNWGLLVTLVGWLFFIMGAFRLLFVKLWVSMIVKGKNVVPVWLPVFMLVLGLLLLNVGFFIHVR